MTAQAAYGAYGQGFDVPLVPQSLTVYRHFQVYQNKLHPMTMKHNTPYIADSNVYVATCTKGAEHKGDKVPSSECTCGFYASYDPETDFFPETNWDSTNVITVHGVTDVSGRVVMGEKGVRAGKLSIVAMAIDWAKCSAGRKIGSLYHLASQIVEEVADMYQIEYYESCEEMLDTYPQPDISHLLADTAPKPKVKVKVSPAVYSPYTPRKKAKSSAQLEKWSPYYRG